MFAGTVPVRRAKGSFCVSHNFVGVRLPQIAKAGV